MGHHILRLPLTTACVNSVVIFCVRSVCKMYAVKILSSDVKHSFTVSIDQLNDLHTGVIRFLSCVVEHVHMVIIVW